jgi:hypothetical protein
MKTSPAPRLLSDGDTKLSDERNGLVSNQRSTYPDVFVQLNRHPTYQSRVE